MPTAALSIKNDFDGLDEISSSAWLNPVADALDEAYVGKTRYVRAASTANVDIASAPAAIDGVTLANGDRVLLKNQSTGSQNGIRVFTAAGAALARGTDSNSAAKFVPGLLISVSEGTANGNTIWQHTTDAGFTLDTTSLTFQQGSGAGAYAPVDPQFLVLSLNGTLTGERRLVAGTALTGNDGGAGGDYTLNVAVDDVTVEVNSDALRLKAGGITHSHVNAANIDGLAATASMRTLGTGAQQAAAGNHTHAEYLNKDGSVALTAHWNVGGFRLTNLTDPSADQDAATKAYVDGVASGLDIKQSVRAASTGNVNTASPGASLDGVTLSTGDRILLKDQSTGSQNGIYVWTGAASALTRSTDADASAEVTTGMFVFVSEGTTNADSGWVLTTNDPITLGVTSLAFTQFSGAGQITAGSALTKTGNTLDVAVDNSSIEISGDALRIKALGITNAMLAGSIDGGTKISGGTITPDKLTVQPVLDKGRAATGWIRLISNPNDGDTVAINVGGVTSTYEFDSGGGVTGGNVAVTIGGSAAASATNLNTAITATQGTGGTNVLSSSRPSTEGGTTVDLGLQTVGTALTLTESTGGVRIALLDRGEEEAAQDRFLLPIRHVIVAEEVTRGRIRIRPAVTAIDRIASFEIQTSTGDTTRINYNGVVTIVSGILDFDNTGGTDFAAGNVVYAMLWCH